MVIAASTAEVTHVLQSHADYTEYTLPPEARHTVPCKVSPDQITACCNSKNTPYLADQ